MPIESHLTTCSGSLNSNWGAALQADHVEKSCYKICAGLYHRCTSIKRVFLIRWPVVASWYGMGDLLGLFHLQLLRQPESVVLEVCYNGG